jgi:hypothetical protein
MAGLAAGVLLSIAMGYALTSRVTVAGAGTRRLSLLLATSLAIGMGLGVSACVFFVWIAVIGPAGPGFVVVEVLLLAGFVLVSRRTLLQPSIRWSPASPRPAPLPAGWLWLGVVGVSVAASVILFILRSVSEPHGGWDAWMTWNVAARFLFRGESHWQDAFSPSFRHPDYPLLLPGTVARLWTYMGTDSVMAPATVAMMFTFATVGVAGASLALLRTGRQSILGVLMLLATQSLITHGASQYADIPLAFFVLATVVLLSLHARAEQGRGLMALAGAAAGFATWTKNEGVLFLAATVVARSAAIALRHGWRTYVSELRWFAVGLAPVLAVVAYFKLCLAPANEFVAGQGLADTLPRLLDAGRYLAVARVFKSEVLHLGYNGVVGAIPLLVVYVLCVGLKVDTVDRPALATCLGALALVLGGYVAVLVTAPGDFLRLLNRSVDRLLLHLWPTIVFICFMIARPPEETTD